MKKVTFISYFVRGNIFFLIQIETKISFLLFLQKVLIHSAVTWLKKNLFCVGKYNFQSSLEEKDKSFGTIAIKKEKLDTT